MTAFIAKNEAFVVMAKTPVLHVANGCHAWSVLALRGLSGDRWDDTWVACVSLRVSLGSRRAFLRGFNDLEAPSGNAEGDFGPVRSPLDLGPRSSRCCDPHSFGSLREKGRSALLECGPFPAGRPEGQALLLQRAQSSSSGGRSVRVMKFRLG